jgi:transposase
MSKSGKRQYTNSEKVKIALEAIKGELTIAQISSKYEVHSTQITNWKKLAIEAMGSCFSKKSPTQNNDDQRLIEDLYKQIGKLSTECEWLKKKSELFKC